MPLSRIELTAASFTESLLQAASCHRVTVAAFLGDGYPLVAGFRLGGAFTFYASYRHDHLLARGVTRTLSVELLVVDICPVRVCVSDVNVGTQSLM